MLATFDLLVKMSSSGAIVYLYEHAIIDIYGAIGYFVFFLCVFRALEK